MIFLVVLSVAVVCIALYQILYKTSIVSKKIVNNENSDLTNSANIDYKVISESAEDISWDSQNNLYYYDSSSGLFKWKDGKSSFLVDVYSLIADGDINEPAEVNNVKVFPDGKQILVWGSRGVSDDSKTQLFTYRLDTKKRSVLNQFSKHFLIAHDGSSIWGYGAGEDTNSNDILWNYKLTGETEKVTLSQAQDINPFGILIDNSEKYVAMDNENGLFLWNLSSGNLNTQIKNVSDYVWLNGSSTGLAYLGKDGSLYFINLGNDYKTTLLSGISKPIAERPGSTEILYTVFKPSIGGSEIWEVDVKTKKTRIVSSAMAASGKISSFVMSPDGRKIAASISNTNGTGSKLLVISLGK